MEEIKLNCPVMKKCAGCQLNNLTYADQLKMKQAKIGRLLKEFGRIRPIIGMDDPFNYRNKAYGAVGFIRGKFITGIYQSKSGHIIECDSCRIENPTAGKIIADVRDICKKLKITAYDQISGKGFLRHILVRTAHSGGEVLVSLTGTASVFPNKAEFCDMLLSLHPEITTIVFGARRDKIALMEPEKQEVLYGDGYITDELCGMKFRIGAKTFYQVNSKQTEVLYSKAIAFAELSGSETVLDAYCGIGTIGLIAAKNAKKIIGVEINENSIENAKINAENNGIENAEFVCDDAGNYMRKIATKHASVDVVFTDPPRQGCSKVFLDSLIKLSPKKIVYISCGPEALKRDLHFLVKNGYKVKKIQPIDMFPFTNHVETVVLLKKTSIYDNGN